MGYHGVTGYLPVTAELLGIFAAFIKSSAMEKFRLRNINQCAHNLLAIKDTLNVLSGKWMIPVIGILRMNGRLHFRDMITQLPGISAKVLTATLREMEVNMIVSRTVLETKPVKVAYELTEYGATLENVIFEMLNWGLTHRTQITGRNKLNIPPMEYVRQLQHDLPETESSYGNC